MPTTYNSASLAWDAPIEGTTGQYPASQLTYQIWRSLALGGPYANIDTTTIQGVTVYTDNTVSSSTTYYYYAVSVDPTGEVGLPSNTIQVTTPIAPPVLTYVVSGPTPSFVQGNSGSVAPGGSSPTITATYKKAQTAGNTNVIILWPAAALQATNPVQDTAGNIYVPLSGFTPQTMPGQSAFIAIYTCATSNQAAGANTVTVNMSSSSYGEMVVLEYTSLTPVTFDGFTDAGDASGNTAGGSSPITPGNATDLLITFFISDINFASVSNPPPALCGPTIPPPGWNLETTASTNPSSSFGTSFTADLQTYSLGTYTPAWSQNVTNPNPGYTQNPWACFSLALKSTLSTPPPTSNIPLSWTETDASVTTYHLKYGTTNGGPYNVVLNVGNITSYTVIGLNPGTYYLVVSALNSVTESVNSDQVTAVVSGSVIPINASVLIR